MDADRLEELGVQAFPAPLLRIAKEVGGREVMFNTAALGAAAGVTGLDLGPMNSVMEDNFGRKGAAVAEGNRKVARAAFDFMQERYAARFPWKLQTRNSAKRMVLNGNQAFSMGALLGGCKFVAGYPMTPGSPVLEWLAAHAQRYGIVVKHTEDEISAAAMVVGAAHMGVRALTPTSGGGFCQMTESLGLAGMTETPIVIYNAQRPGPSTGLPTRTEQGDLMFVLHASQGDFPRIVLAPGTIEETFEAGWRAFNLAETYQCPVIVLTDHFLVSSLRDVPPEALDFGAVTIERGKLLSRAEMDALPDDYLRHRVTDDGISPRAVAGHPQGVYSVTSDEHDEAGHIDEAAETRNAQNEKRMRKLETAAGEMRPPLRYGPAEADVTFIDWGSTYGPLREAVDLLNTDGTKANLLHITDVWPFPTRAVAQALAGAKKTFVVESNYTGQMAGLIRRETGHQADGVILRYDGRAFSPESILRGFEEEMHHG
ncbi:MAG: 2-oxoacid:acceptor oxidoreductase subunit alpha [Chloroflexi bacterium]|nr:2-oxoacid:acceptor oxidoreductase subunit alpha [Chloroflexota bacterium]